MTEEDIRDALREVIDPELGIDIVDLGLVYGIEVAGNDVRVALTRTTPSCPLGELISDEAEAAIRARVPGVDACQIDLVWEPPWSPDRMSEAALRLLGGA